MGEPIRDETLAFNQRMSDERIADLQLWLAGGKHRDGEEWEADDLLMGVNELMEALLAEREYAESTPTPDVQAAADALADATDAILGEDTPETCNALADALDAYRQARQQTPSEKGEAR